MDQYTLIDKLLLNADGTVDPEGVGLIVVIGMSIVIGLIVWKGIAFLKEYYKNSEQFSTVTKNIEGIQTMVNSIKTVLEAKEQSSAILHNNIESLLTQTASIYKDAIKQNDIEFVKNKLIESHSTIQSINKTLDSILSNIRDIEKDMNALNTKDAVIEKDISILANSLENIKQMLINLQTKLVTRTAHTYD